MGGFKCPFCNEVMSVDYNTYQTATLSFFGIRKGSYKLSDDNHEIMIEFYRCPNCEEVSIFVNGVSDHIKDLHVNVYPESNAIKFPDYIPAQIRADYEEACAIVNLSPKASATLSRRCLQGMIHDFWGISEKNLNAEITSLKNNVHPTQWKVIDGLRRLGNIGAHMEKDINTIVDIDPDEASKLIKLIELLVDDWYIKRHEQEQLYTDILEIDSAKQEQRKS